MGDCEEKVEDLKKQIIELNEKLEAAEALKSHFISNITNEIVNPFSSILGLSTQILETDSVSVEQMKYLASLIHTETFHLDFQLRNIFAAAKIEAGQAEPEIRNIDLEEMFSELIELFELEAGKRNVAIEFSISGHDSSSIWATDGVKLRLIIINFLHNAVKFTKEETVIEIKVEKSEDQLVVRIKDFGIGISEEDSKAIFDRFKAVKAGINTAYRGNGLGLSVNKALTDILGGEILIDSKVGAWTEFSLVLPFYNGVPVDVEAGTEFLFDDELIF